MSGASRELESFEKTDKKFDENSKKREELYWKQVLNSYMVTPPDPVSGHKHKSCHSAATVTTAGVSNRTSLHAKTQVTVRLH